MCPRQGPRCTAPCTRSDATGDLRVGAGSDFVSKIMATAKLLGCCTLCCLQRRANARPQRATPTRHNGATIAPHWQRRSSCSRRTVGETARATRVCPRRAPSARFRAVCAACCTQRRGLRCRFRGGGSRACATPAAPPRVRPAPHVRRDTSARSPPSSTAHRLVEPCHVTDVCRRRAALLQPSAPRTSLLSAPRTARRQLTRRHNGQRQHAPTRHVLGARGHER